MSRTSTSRGAIGAVACLAGAIFISVVFVAATAGPSELPGFPDSNGRLVPRPSSSVLAYGDDPAQFGRLVLPEVDADSAASGPYPVAVLIHGGFWKRSIGDLSIMDELADRLTSEGFAVWNIEYGRVGERNGGWPHTFEHVGEALDYLAAIEANLGAEPATLLSPDEVAVFGHSAGGHLALWLRTRAELPDESAAVTPTAVIAVAPIAELEIAWQDGLGENAVGQLLGGSPAEFPDRFGYASAQRPSPIPTLVVVSTADDDVPLRYSMGVPNATVVTVDGVEHLSLIQGRGQGIDAALDWYGELSS